MTTRITRILAMGTLATALACGLAPSTQAMTLPVTSVQEVAGAAPAEPVYWRGYGWRGHGWGYRRAYYGYGWRRPYYRWGWHGQGVDVLEKRGWDDLCERVMVASYSASRSLRIAAI